MIRWNLAKAMQEVENAQTPQGSDGEFLMGKNGATEETGIDAAQAEREQFRNYVLDYARSKGVDVRHLDDVRTFLVREFGPSFESTARRVLEASIKPTAKTKDRLAAKVGKRFVFRETAVPAEEDRKTVRAKELTRLAPTAKHAKKEDLARLAEDAAADPADVKLVAMMLLMFRDA